ncbi:MAG: NADH-quinone oxidoreductase subunit F, partial [Candidatus Eremiobacteraeota bacterium]|nr:NADH-quinone oxidoreductase subunit F [Candidatus Eremiobacteraeota bacterium]
MGEKRVLFEFRDVPDMHTLKAYKKQGGYKGLKMALQKSPEDLIEYIKASGLRGRGGAGFPTGLKWSFVPKNPGKPKYLCVNADESEPGTCKDRELITYLPHQLVEGIVICCYAVGIERAFIYIRGEMFEAAQILEEAVKEAYDAGFLGQNILKSGFNLDLLVHRGAGAYICGEESAL